MSLETKQKMSKRIVLSEKDTLVETLTEAHLRYDGTTLVLINKSEKEIDKLIEGVCRLATSVKTSMSKGLSPEEIERDLDFGDFVVVAMESENLTNNIRDKILMVADEHLPRHIILLGGTTNALIELESLAERNYVHLTYITTEDEKTFQSDSKLKGYKISKPDFMM